jgi:hypothetical protein
LPDGSLPTKILVDQQRHSGFRALARHLPRSFERRCERLLAHHWQLVLRCQGDEPGVRFHVSDDVGEIQLLVAQQLLRVVIDRRYAKFLRQRFRFGFRAIVDCHTPRPANLLPAGELEAGPEAGPKRGKSQVTHSLAPPGNRWCESAWLLAQTYRGVITL